MIKVICDKRDLDRFITNLQSGSFQDTLKRIARDLSKALLKHIKGLTPVDATHQLIAGWGGNSFLVVPYLSGYEVLIVNTTAYAEWVNDGHQSFNQFGGPWLVQDHVTTGPFGKPKGRLKVPVAHQWQQGNPLSTFVYGHFFVERGILQFKNTQEIEQIIMNELTKWWGRL